MLRKKMCLALKVQRANFVSHWCFYEPALPVPGAAVSTGKVSYVLELRLSTGAAALPGDA